MKNVIATWIINYQKLQYCLLSDGIKRNVMLDDQDGLAMKNIASVMNSSTEEAATLLLS